MNNNIALILFSSSMLAACGGGGGGKSSTPTTPTSSTPAAPASSMPASSIAAANLSSTTSSTAPSAVILQGQFKDTNVAGLHFVSGAQTGVTNSTGTFNYEQGENITFSIGAIELGSTLGKTLITPIDLVSNGNSAVQAVKNRVRFLLMLDADGYANNGIQISSTVQTAANSWAPIDFTSTTFSADATTYMMAATAADGGTHLLPDDATAQAHVEATHWCNYSGVFQGTFSDANNGNIGLWVDALSGKVAGITYIASNNNLISLDNKAAIDFQQNVTFMSGDNTPDNSRNYLGNFTTVNAIGGSWVQGDAQGTLSAARIGGAAMAAYRFSAIFSGSDSGLLSIDVDQSNKISGTSYNVKTHNSKTLSGTLVGPKLTASISNDMQLEGMLNTEAGTLTGTWSNASAGTSGTFLGSGCQLNPIALSINGFRNWKTGSDPSSIQTFPASGTDPLILLDGNPVARVRMNVKPWAEMSFPITYIEPNGEAAKVDLTGSEFIEVTYQANQSVNLQLRQYAVHGGTHNQITLPAAATFTTARIPLSNFVGGLTPLDLTKVAKFDFALLSNNVNDGYAELIVKGFKIDKFN